MVKVDKNHLVIERVPFINAEGDDTPLAPIVLPLSFQQVQDSRTFNPSWLADTLTALNAESLEKTGAGLDLSYANLYGLDLKKINLVRANLEGADLRDTRLRNAVLSGANLTNAHLVKADMEDVDAAKTNFSGAALIGATLTNATLSTAIFEDADLSGALLAGLMDKPYCPDVPFLDGGCLRAYAAALKSLTPEDLQKSAQKDPSYPVTRPLLHKMIPNDFSRQLLLRQAGNARTAILFCFLKSEETLALPNLFTLDEIFEPKDPINACETVQLIGKHDPVVANRSLQIFLGKEAKPLLEPPAPVARQAGKGTLSLVFGTIAAHLKKLTKPIHGLKR